MTIRDVQGATRRARGLKSVKATCHAPMTPSRRAGCNEESEGEVLLGRVQRAFKTHDPSEGGFIAVSALAEGQPGTWKMAD
jgi:hypothetical protein